jgi:hypothetical protein
MILFSKGFEKMSGLVAPYREHDEFYRDSAGLPFTSAWLNAVNCEVLN